VLPRLFLGLCVSLVLVPRQPSEIGLRGGERAWGEARTRGSFQQAGGETLRLVGHGAAAELLETEFLRSVAGVCLVCL